MYGYISVFGFVSTRLFKLEIYVSASEEQELAEL